MREHIYIQTLYEEIEDMVAQAMTSIEYVGAMKGVMVEEIKDKVYNAYNPAMYDRKKYNGGLIDTVDTIKDYYDFSELTLSIANERMGYSDDSNMDRYVTPVIVTGVGYNWTGIDEFFRRNDQPRDFLTATEDSLESSGKHVTKLESILNSKGYNVYSS